MEEKLKKQALSNEELGNVDGGKKKRYNCTALKTEAECLTHLQDNCHWDGFGVIEKVYFCIWRTIPSSTTVIPGF